MTRLLFFKCLTSPALLMIGNSVRWEKYHPNSAEAFGDRVISLVATCWYLGLYGSPVTAFILYRLGYYSYEGVSILSKFVVSVGVIVGTSYCLRSYGRMTNEKYLRFQQTFEEMQESTSRNTLKAIKKYDFDFAEWPVEFNGSYGSNRSGGSGSWRSTISSLIQSPCSIVGYLVLHTFGIRLIYPGSMTILNYLLSSTLMDGRKALIEEMKGERYKLKTADGNYIDTMFVEKRSLSSTSSGNTLVICSEGNAGFYENGIMPTAIDAGYSVLGWNHPGFGCSTGTPYPNQEQNAMDTVMQFAIKKLGFQPGNIILYGWSIGGYATAWAAKHYPVRTVVVDASFDDILPLALNQMPDILESLVRLTIRSYADLNVARFLVDYQGPIKLVRRTQDEIICIQPGILNTNRGNHLLVKVLKRRFPMLFNNQSEQILNDWLDTSGTSRITLLSNVEVDNDKCQRLLREFEVANGSSYPYTSLGDELSESDCTKLLIFLANHYMVDFRSNHTTPLPSNVFQELIKL